MDTPSLVQPLFHALAHSKDKGRSLSSEESKVDLVRIIGDLGPISGEDRRADGTQKTHCQGHNGDSLRKLLSKSPCFLGN